MLPIDNNSPIDISALRAQIDADIAAQLLDEADAAQHIHRRSFRIGELNLLVALNVSSEVAEMPPVCHLPGAPYGVKGLVNRYGRVIPVVDLITLFNLKSKPVLRPWLLVCGRGEDAVGLIIDSLPVRKIFTHESEVILSNIVSPIAGFAKAAYLQEEEVWMDLDTEAFFATVFNMAVA